MADVDESGAEVRGSKPKSPAVILVIACLLLLWLILMFMNPDLYEDFGFGWEKEMWVYVASGIMIIFMIILLVVAIPSKIAAQVATATTTQMIPIAKVTSGMEPRGVVISAAEPEMEAAESEPLVVEAEIVEAEVVEEEEEKLPAAIKSKKPTLVEYPKKVPGGVYGDTIARVGPTTKLNLRTLLVRSCLICDRQGKCWEEVQDSISRDDFLENIECKKGLRKLKGEEPERKPIKKKKMKKKMVRKVAPVETREEPMEVEAEVVEAEVEKESKEE